MAEIDRLLRPCRYHFLRLVWEQGEEGISCIQIKRKTGHSYTTIRTIRRVFSDMGAIHEEEGRERRIYITYTGREILDSLQRIVDALEEQL